MKYAYNKIIANKHFDEIGKKTLQTNVAMNDLYDIRLCGSNTVYCHIQGVPKKTDTQFYFWDNFGNSAPILTIRLLLQAEIYGA